MRRISRILYIISALISIFPLLVFPYTVQGQGTRPEGSWGGTWHTRWSIMEYGVINSYELDMVFTQSGSQVTGSSDYYGWQLTGSASGNNLTGTWSNSWNNPNQHPHINGQVKLTLSSSGTSFSGLFIGQYHYGIWDNRFTVTGTRYGSVAPQPITPTPLPQPYIPPTPDITPGPIMPTPLPSPNITPAPISPTIPITTGACRFDGVWATDFGDMTLTVNDNKLTGSYSSQGGRIDGTMVDKMTAIGTWSEAPSYQPPNDAGDFIFTIQPGCQTMEGHWRYGSCDWDGDIVGTRAGQPTPPAPPNPIIPTPITPTPITPTPPVPDTVSGPWAGTWDTNWDDMVLAQNGNQVSGTYGHDNGKISGTVSGDTFSGWWSEAPSYSPPDDAGSVELTMGPEHQTISGRWRYGSSGSWYENGWHGTRRGLLKSSLEFGASAPAACDWTGTWDFDWSNALNLTQSGNRVTGSYKPSGWNYTGYIEGTLSGTTLIGTWTENDQSGKLEWAMLAGCNSFTGRYTHSLTATSGWYPLHAPGTRVGQPQPGPEPQQDITPIPQPVNLGWAGTWNTDWDKMEISVSGNQGSGTYTANSGKLIGTISGNTFGGTWSRSPSYAAPRDAGAFSFTMSEDGNSFKGDWKYSDCSWQGPWNGKLIGSDVTPIPNPDIHPMPIPPYPNPNPTPGVNRPPQASFYTNPQLPTTSTAVSLISESYDPDGDQLSYTWIRDGSVLNECANQPNCNWYNPAAGNHIVTLIVNDGKGGQTPFQTQVNVTLGTGPSPAPVPPTPVPVPPNPTPTPVPGANNAPSAAFSFDPPQPQVGQTVQVTSQSTDADGDKLSYSWSLDGQLLAQQTGQMVWKWKVPSGGHVMQLEVNDGRGGRDTVSRKIKGADGTTPDGSKKKWKIGPFSCFIATAAYGSETAGELDMLRSFRDRVLMRSESGKLLVGIYYRLSPPLAEYIAEHEGVRTFVREGLLDPVVGILKQTENWWNR